VARIGELRIAVIAGALLLLAACAGQPVAPPNHAREDISRTPTVASAGGPSVAGLARTLIGAPYTYGGADPSGFDCSGLVFYAFSKSGFAVPRTSLDQFRAARKISLTDAVAGDLVFFQDQAKLSHVGIYLGDGTFVHAPASGRTVTVASLESPYYQEHLVAVGRLLPH